MINVLIADDHPLFREAISKVLSSSMGKCTIHETQDVKQTLAYIQRHHNLDLILLELNMPDSDGFNTLLDLRYLAPTVPVVAVAAKTNRQTILQSITYGAVGFITKSSSREEIGFALHQILKGNVYLPAHIIRAGTEPLPPIVRQQNTQKIAPEALYTLTRRQLLVLKAMAQGSSNKQIAYNLSISETTVKSHVSAILKKLGVHNRTQAVVGLTNTDFDQYLQL